jgi:hypothetical protein
MCGTLQKTKNRLMVEAMEQHLSDCKLAVQLGELLLDSKRETNACFISHT